MVGRWAQVVVARPKKKAVARIRRMEGVAMEAWVVGSTWTEKV